MNRTVELIEVCDFLDNQRIPIEESLRKSGPYPYYGANGIQDWVDGYIFDEPLILLAEDGGHFGSKTQPIAYKITGKSWVNNHAHVLRPKKNCDIDYLCFILSLYDVSSIISGTTRPKLTKGNAESISFPLPPLPEQKRIAAILQKADRLRRLRRYARQLSDGYLQSVFLEMFGDPATNLKGWEKGYIDDVISMSQYGTSTKSNNEQKGFPILGMANITYSGQLDLSSVANVELSEDEFQSLKLEKGDIIFNRTNSTELVGKTALWNVDQDAVLASYLIKIKVNPKVTPDFLCALMNTQFYKRLFRDRCKKAIGQSNVSPTLLREFPVFIPPINLQKKYSDKATSSKRLFRIQVESERQAELLFQSLLQRAFQGEL